MKILYYTPRFMPDPQVGGRAYTVKNFAQALSRRGYKVYIVSHWKGQTTEYVEKGVKIIRAYPLTNNRFIDYIKAPVRELKVCKLLRKIVKKEGIDLIDVHGPTYGFRFPPKKPLYCFRGWECIVGQRPLIYTFEGNLEYSRNHTFKNYKVFEANVISEALNANLIITRNNITASIFKEKIFRKRIEVIYNFLEKDFISQYKEIYPDHFTVLYVGGTLQYKGYRDVLKVYKKLKSIIPSVKFIMIGPGLKRVPRSIMPKLYLSSTVLLAPSYREGFGMSIVEASAMGRPVVATNVGGIPEIVIHRETGFLVNPGDVKGMVNSLLELAYNKSLVREMGLRGRKRVLKFFTEDAVIPKLIKIYEEIVNYDR